MEVYYNKTIKLDIYIVSTKLFPTEKKSAKREIRRATACEYPIVKNIVRRKGRTHRKQLLHNGQFMGYNNGRERFVKSIQVYVQDHL